MPTEQQQLEVGIAALEAQRPLLGDAAVEAVNIAARMEQTTPAGALRISQDTYAQVRGLFEVEVQEPLAIKGVIRPVREKSSITTVKC